MSDTTDLRLILHIEDSRNGVLGNCGTAFLNAKLSVCYMTSEGLRGPLYEGYGDAKRLALGALADLEITCQTDIGSDDEKPWYGWSLEYRNVYSVNLGHAETMVKTLRGIQRKLDKLSDRFGVPQTFGDYAGRVASALGVGNRAFGRKVEANRDYDGSGYQWGDVDSLRWWLDDAVKVANKR